MNQAVSYAYVRRQGERPSIMDQVMACRAYAEARGYSIIGEFNDIDTSDHPNQNAGMAAVRETLAEAPEAVVLICQPDPEIHDQLTASGATLEAVPALEMRAAAHT
jgi:hypothetical protein